MTLRSHGFTIVETLLALVVSGVILAFALTHFQGAKQQAYVSAMKHDLRNFAVAQELYHEQNNAYANDPAEVGGFEFSPDVAYLSSAKNADRWAMSVGHAKTDTECSLSIGMGPDASYQVRCAGGDVGFSASTTSPEVGDEVTFDASLAIADMAYNSLGVSWGTPLYAARPDDIAKLIWDFGDGTLLEGPPETHTVVQHTYQEGHEGVTVRLILERKDGRVAKGHKGLRVGHTKKAASDADFSIAGVPVVVGTPASFSVVRPLNTDNYAFEWAFGDGTAASGHAVAHTYESPGTYEVELTVTSMSGETFTETKSIVVTLEGLDEEELWAPNHKLRTVEFPTSRWADADGIEATALSSEPDDEGGAGSTSGDIRVIHPDGSLTESSNAAPLVTFNPLVDQLALRAERDGDGEGRTYSVTVTFTVDGATTEDRFVFFVPHDRRAK